MHRFLLFSLLVVPYHPGMATEPTVTLPWEEFRGLYTEEVRRDLEAARPPEAKPAVVALERADLRLRVGNEGARGELVLAGQCLAGEPEPVRLLPARLAVTGISEAQGAVLARCGGDYCLHLDGTDGFRLALAVALPLERGEHERLLRLDLPPAVTRSLVLEFEDGVELLEEPGLPREDGRYYLVGDRELSLRLNEPARETATQAPVVDTFTRIQAQGEGLAATSWFLPLRMSATELGIALSPAARLMGSDLPAGSLRELGEGRVAVRLDPDREAPFELRYQLPLAGEGGAEEAVRLPRIEANLGREDGFVLVQPEDGRITLAAERLQGPLTPERLAAPLRQAAGLDEGFFRSGGDLTLALERYQTVASPELVLDTLHLYTSYADNGRALSVLRLTLPPGTGDRLALAAMAGADIWYLKVNGRPRRLYAQDQGTWVVPLDRGRDSEVELAFLRQGPRLGLEGRVELAMPPIGITARQLHLGVSLAERVSLVAVEGDLVPVQGDGWPQVEGIAGQLHHFVLPFYRGDAVTAAIYYREPALAGEEG